MWRSFWKNDFLLRILSAAQGKYNNHYTSRHTAKIRIALRQTWEVIPSEGCWEGWCCEKFANAESKQGRRIWPVTDQWMILILPTATKKIISSTSSEIPLLLVSLEGFHVRYFCCLLYPVSYSSSTTWLQSLDRWNEVKKITFLYWKDKRQLRVRGGSTMQISTRDFMLYTVLEIICNRMHWLVHWAALLLAL